MDIRNALLSDPITTTPDETFRQLLPRLVTSRQATAAVLDDDRKLLGLLGIYDVLRKIVPHYVDLDDKLMEVMHEDYFEERLSGLEGLQVRDFMSTSIDSVSPHDSLIKAVALIVERKRKTLPVLDERGCFLGMVTRRSIFEHVIRASGWIS